VTASERQAEIDRVHWYHEFDFGNGLRARSVEPDVRPHRRVWRFIERQLDAIDLRGKSVLDIGCWDGYWSFFAERKGAKSVLASDDLSQSWSDGKGLYLAKRLYGSGVEIRQDLSIYRLATLGRTFDVILCLGVYYHLIDPFYAFAQLRHCCHPETVVLLEGDVGIGLGPNEVLHSFGSSRMPAFLPSAEALKNLLKSAYLSIRSQIWESSPRGVRGLLKRALRGRAAAARVLTTCVPFEGVNDRHPFEPPFGLKAYDQRFRSVVRETERLSA